MRRKRVFYEGIKIYNSLSLRIKQYDGLKILTRELKEYILNFVFCILYFVFCSLYFVFYISYLKISEEAK